jgi:L-amino acid N-acyltransferase YncA
MIAFRPATRLDDDALWAIFQAVIAPGDSFVFETDMSREEAMAYWFRSDTHPWVALHGSRIVGSYIFRANQPGRGAHVANASFMVSPEARGLGVGKRMGEHCLAEASRLGFRAMQFNIVVSTNEVAVRLWQQLGFSIVGTLPGAFRHARLGWVDAYVMFRQLEQQA